MRAAVLREYGEPLDLASVPDPVLADGEALLEVSAVGLCATDLKLLSGGLAHLAELPVIPGHEVCGRVVRGGGSGLDGRRAACYLYESCGRCRLCLVGHPTACRSAVRIGTERDGGLATYLAVKRRNLIPVADHVSDEHAAVTMDAVAAPWSALHRQAAIGPGSLVLIVGAGGLGIHAVQIARMRSARVAVVDVSASRRERALELGAELALDPADAGGLREWSEGGFDVALECSGRREGFEVAANALRPGGRVVCNGYAPGVEYGVDSMRLVLDEIEIVGSRLGSFESSRAALGAVERGDVVPQIGMVVGFDEVNDAFGALAEGSVDGRIVVRVGA
jgi:D-arabinose 1-dehydrogenase-like Zn-dependent alcohol dehydrogenase